jgi:hypothetical protein
LPEGFVYRDFDDPGWFHRGSLKVVIRASTSEGKDGVSSYIERTNTWETFHLENMLNNLKRVRI